MTQYILTIAGIGLLGFSVYVKVKEKTNIISGLKISEKALEKHKKYIANEYGNAMIVLSIACIISGFLMMLINNTITFLIGMILIIIAALRMSSVRNYLVNKKYK